MDKEEELRQLIQFGQPHEVEGKAVQIMKDFAESKVLKAIELTTGLKYRSDQSMKYLQQTIQSPE